MQSVRIAGAFPIHISNRGIPKWRLGNLPGASFISPGNNVQGTLLETFGGSFPAITFHGWWKSNSSQVLVHYDFNNPPTE